MNDLELIALWYEDYARDVRRALRGLGPEALAWRPDSRANNIGETIWHTTRWIDLLAARALQNGPPEAELWHTAGWRDRTGYDPRGIGEGGLGSLTGYTWEEVLAVPVLSADELLAYLDPAAQTLADCLRGLRPEALRRPAPGLGGTTTVYDWVVPVLKGCYAHLGEVRTIRAMYQRQQV